MKKRYYSETLEESFNQGRMESLIIAVGVNVPSREKELWSSICKLDDMEVGDTCEIMGDTITRNR